MEKKTLFRFLVILLGLSYVVFASAVPVTRSSMMGKKDPMVQAHLVKVPPTLPMQEVQVMGLRNSEELLDMKEETSVESRIMMDIVDYPGTKPNPAHDPKSPGKP